MAKEEMLEVDGVVTEVLPDGIAYTMTMETSETPAEGAIRWAQDGDQVELIWVDEGDMSKLFLGGLLR